MSADNFMPHGHCYLWKPELVQLHVISDFLIAAAYFSIPFTLLHFVRRRRDLPFNWMFVCFGVFIIACGLTHVMDVWTMWKPDYWASGIIKAITAAASVPTAILLLRLVPQAMSIPSPTTLQTANEALREQTKMLNLIVNNIGDGLLVVDHSGRSLLTNPAAKRMLGVNADNEVPENCGTDCGFYRSDKVTRIEAQETPTSRAMRGETVDEEEIFLRRPDSEEGVWAAVTARPLRDERGMIHGAVAVFHDLNAQKQAAMQQENLRRERQARVEAEEASRAKDQFLAMLGHELRTPLTPVLATVDLLGHSADAETLAGLQIIRRNVELEARLIDDMLDLTAIKKGKMSLHPEAVDAHAVLRNAFSTFEVEIERKRLRTSFDLAAENHFVFGDPARLLQVLWNLTKNAIKFTPEGGELRFSSRNDQREILVEVADNGSGIEAAFLPRLFQSFEQGQRQVREGHGGLGLGLAISKGIADAQGWDLTAASEGRDRGTTMTLRMPITLEVPAGKTADAAATTSGPATLKMQAESPLRILLVDDHKDTVRTLKMLLTRLGYEVAAAETVSDALRAADEQQFDLLLTDIGLPDGSGLELMKQIRARHAIKAIALSGFGMEEDLRRSREAGFLDHLTKPVDIDRLQAAIREAQAQLN